MMKVGNVSVSYEKDVVVENISFALEPGQWWMLVGPNGAGKTSLVKAIAGVVPYRGEVRWEGRDARTFTSDQWARHVGVLSQARGMEYGFTVEEIVEMGRYAYRKGLFAEKDKEGDCLLEEALKATGLTEARKRNVLTLSGGQWQRALLAKVFVQNPNVLVLDEPINHLDLVYQKQLFDLIQSWLRQSGRAALSVVHDVSLARKYGTHALLLDQGICVGQGKIQEVFRKERLEAVYGMDVVGWMTELLEQWV